jgi:hypothetical protein
VLEVPPELLPLLLPEPPLDELLVLPPLLEELLVEPPLLLDELLFEPPLLLLLDELLFEPPLLLLDELLFEPPLLLELELLPPELEPLEELCVGCGMLVAVPPYGPPRGSPAPLQPTAAAPTNTTAIAAHALSPRRMDWRSFPVPQRRS